MRFVSGGTANEFHAIIFKPFCSEVNVWSWPYRELFWSNKRGKNFFPKASKNLKEWK